jgi:hypothetical protein
MEKEIKQLFRNELAKNSSLVADLISNNNLLQKVAEKIFFDGHIEITSSGKIKKVYVFDVEFYCNQDGKFLDPVMYHTNDKISQKEKGRFIFENSESGAPLIHPSGMDIILYEENGVRITMLIRGIIILEDGDMNVEKVTLNRNDRYHEIECNRYRIETRPTYIIGQILCGSIFNGGILIKWVDDKIPKWIKDKSCSPLIIEQRKNIKEDNQNDKLWRFRYFDYKNNQLC